MSTQTLQQRKAHIRATRATRQRAELHRLTHRRTVSARLCGVLMVLIAGVLWAVMTASSGPSLAINAAVSALAAIGIMLILERCKR